MRTAIDDIRAQIKAKEAKRIELQDDIEALQRTLRILQAESTKMSRSRHQETPRGMPTTTKHRNGHPRAIPDVAAEVLREAGKPLSGEQLIPLLAARGIHSSKQTILGGLYRATNKNRLFKKAGPGMFALLEWTERNHG